LAEFGDNFINVSRTRRRIPWSVRAQASFWRASLIKLSPNSGNAENNKYDS
jgi:hypothetical protein